jgi:glycosyltransferase involved in cell wall biosynthesis
VMARFARSAWTTSLWQGIYHGCYRGSRTATATVALMLGVHRRLGTWSRLVDCHIALTEFSRKKFIDIGLPANKIVVKPNFVLFDPVSEDPQSASVNHKLTQDSYVLFVGRLSEEKGVRTLLRAFQQLHNRIPLEVVGDGPLRGELEEETTRQRSSGISFHGRLNLDRVRALMKQARFLVFPSECYETFGLSLVEAFACGVPVVCTRLAAMQEIVADGRTGLHFNPGDSEDLAAKVEWAWTHSQDMDEMGRAARAEYEGKYTTERNYPMLMNIYQRAISSKSDKNHINHARWVEVPDSRLGQDWAARRI